MQEAARKQLDVPEHRWLSPADEPQEFDSEVDHLKKAWESTAKALAIASEQLKRRAIIPILRWALSALGDVSDDQDKVRSELLKLERSLALEKESHNNTRLRCLQQKRSLDEANEKLRKIELRCAELNLRSAKEKEKYEHMRLRCQELERRLDEANENFRKIELRCAELAKRSAKEEEKYEQMRLRCQELERSLHEEKERREKMKSPTVEHENMRRRCMQLETSLRAEEENARKMKLILARMKVVIAKAEKTLEISKEEDKKLLNEIESLKALGAL